MDKERGREIIHSELAYILNIAKYFVLVKYIGKIRKADREIFADQISKMCEIHQEGFQSEISSS